MLTRASTYLQEAAFEGHKEAIDMLERLDQLGEFGPKDILAAKFEKYQNISDGEIVTDSDMSEIPEVGSDAESKAFFDIPQE